MPKTVLTTTPTASNFRKSKASGPGSGLLSDSLTAHPLGSEIPAKPCADMSSLPMIEPIFSQPQVVRWLKRNEHLRRRAARFLDDLRAPTGVQRAHLEGAHRLHLFVWPEGFTFVSTSDLESGEFDSSAGYAVEMPYGATPRTLYLAMDEEMGIMHALCLQMIAVSARRIWPTPRVRRAAEDLQETVLQRHLLATGLDRASLCERALETAPGVACPH